MGKRIFITVVLTILITMSSVYANELDDLIKTQEDSLGITDFIQESNK